MAVTPVNVVVTTGTVGSATQVVSSANILPSSVFFEAAKANAGTIYVGVSTVSSTAYIASLTAGEKFQITHDAQGEGRIGGVGLQLNAIYIGSSTGTEKCMVTYMNRIGG